MHVTMTQGVVSVDVSLTKEEAQHLAAILDKSHQLWNDPFSRAAMNVEATSVKLFNALCDAGVEPVKVR